jgi:hypothetical protein
MSYLAPALGHTRTQGRAKAVGVQQDLIPFHLAADIYLEGFPFGSLTALLEATLAGLPPILAPAGCPLPYRSDDFALLDLSEPKDVQEYVHMAAELAEQPAKRRHLGEQVRLRTIDTHCGSGWVEYIKGLRDTVRGGLQHEPRQFINVAPLPTHLFSFWSHFCERRSKNNPFSFAFEYSLKAGLGPAVDLSLLLALYSARRQGTISPRAATVAVGGVLLSILPSAIANRIYHKI